MPILPNLMDNPRFKQFIDAFTAVSQASKTLSLDESRKLGTQFFLPSGTVYEPVKSIENIEITGKKHNKIPLRIFIPKEHNSSILMFFHRGGWVFGNLDESEPVCRRLANHLKCIVVAVEYGLAPENPFPRPLEDCYDATQWAWKNAKLIGGDPSRIIVSGESAGGNLAAAVALMARDHKGPPILAQLLIYPAISSSIEKIAFKNCADQFFLTKDSMEFFWSMYLKTPGSKTNPYASPDKAKDFTHLPPAIIITAEHDPLQQEGEHYGQVLLQNGVKVLSKCFQGVIHGFIDLPCYDENQKVKWINEIGQLLNKLT